MAVQTAARKIADPGLKDLRERLEAARRAVLGEIRSYPTPIAGCDVQFNGLIERRAAISRTLDRLDVIERSGLSGSERTRALGALTEGLDWLDDAVKPAPARD